MRRIAIIGFSAVCLALTACQTGSLSAIPSISSPSATTPQPYVAPTPAPQTEAASTTAVTGTVCAVGVVSRHALNTYVSTGTSTFLVVFGNVPETARQLTIGAEITAEPTYSGYRLVASEPGWSAGTTCKHPVLGPFVYSEPSAFIDGTFAGICLMQYGPGDVTVVTTEGTFHMGLTDEPSLFVGNAPSFRYNSSGTGIEQEAKGSLFDVNRCFTRLV